MEIGAKNLKVNFGFFCIEKLSLEKTFPLEIGKNNKFITLSLLCLIKFNFGSRFFLFMQIKRKIESRTFHLRISLNATKHMS